MNTPSQAVQDMIRAAELAYSAALQVQRSAELAHMKADENAEAAKKSFEAAKKLLVPA